MSPDLRKRASGPEIGAREKSLGYVNKRQAKGPEPGPNHECSLLRMCCCSAFFVMAFVVGVVAFFMLSTRKLDTNALIRLSERAKARIPKPDHFRVNDYDLLPDLTRIQASVRDSDRVPLKIMAFNVRGKDLDDPKSPQGWPQRLVEGRKLLRRYLPDVVTMQEPWNEQMEVYSSNGGEKTEVDLGRYRPVHNSGWVGMLYDTKKLDLLKQGTNYVSTTPDQPGGYHWDGSRDRMLVWGIYCTKKGGGCGKDSKTFGVISVHLDHLGDQARVEGAKLMRSEIIPRIIAAAGKDIPIFIAGDFNSPRWSNTYHAMTDPALPSPMKDALFESKEQAAMLPAYSFHFWYGLTWNTWWWRIAHHIVWGLGPMRTTLMTALVGPFMPASWCLHHIDFIWAYSPVDPSQAADLRAEYFGVVTDHNGPVYPSDHFPLMAIYSLDK